MGKLLYAILVGLVGAAIIHIAILFLIPTTTSRDAWSQLEAAGELYQVTPATGSGADVVPLVRDGDPLFRAAACRFDLDDGGLKLSTPHQLPFWSLSIHDRAGQTTYSLTDRASATGSLDVVILSPMQMIEMRRAMPPELERAVFIESTTSQGIVLVRALVPNQSWTGVADRFFRDLDCEPLG
ncbi:DUF1254 domain-containing protein [Tianweitania sp. BSSL-BM11]|uniref:DUF1254 domain-containing protein n=1 Tax=Tianweitania aestuarii TaxID=2814886 RepID=A0ABS5RS88_9HYPH|nr:DUF1254 domain-containing protein [Tianweitania aestuarii]MBS9719876.1 DUF1254 domain-containing protein [Tianweitania aestuarii]